MARCLIIDIPDAAEAFAESGLDTLGFIVEQVLCNSADTTLSQDLAVRELYGALLTAWVRGSVTVSPPDADELARAAAEDAVIFPERG